MRPLDVPVILKLLINEGNQIQSIELSRTLYISQSEISESLNRSKIARLISPDGKTVLKKSFFEFLIYGLKYIFPASPGVLTRGVATAHSAKVFSKLFLKSNDVYVWAYDDGDVRGQMIEPLYKNAVKASLEDDKLYEFLALLDVIRVGNPRELYIATDELKRRILK